MTVPKKIAVIGGGISGLSTAYYLSEARRQENLPVEIRVIEAASRFGGVIHSEKTSEGFLLEHGPDSFAIDKPYALDLCRRLGLEEDLRGVEPGHRRILLRDQDRLFFLPEDFYLIAPRHARTLLKMPFLSWSGKIRMALEVLVPRKRQFSDESVGSFIERRFGREALRKIVQPLIGSIFSCDLYDLSLDATFRRFRELELSSGSVIRGFGKNKKTKESHARNSASKFGLFVTLQHGLGTMVEKLISQTQADWWAGCGVREIKPGNPWQIKLLDGRVMTADYLCLAQPSFQAGELFKNSNQGLRALFAKQPSKSMLLWNVVYRREDLGVLPKASGFVGEADSAIKIQGASFSSLKFSGRTPENAVLLRVFAGRQWLESFREMSDSVISAILHEEIRKILKARAAPIFSKVSKYENAMPHYAVGHLDWLQDVQKEIRKIPSLFLAGNSYQGGGIPDCIRSGEEAAGKIAEAVKLDLKVYDKEILCITP